MYTCKKYTAKSSRISVILLLMDKYVSNTHFIKQVYRTEKGKMVDVIMKLEVNMNIRNVWGS